MLVYLDPDPVNIRNMSRSLGVCLTRATGVGEHLRVRGDELRALHDQSDGLHAGVGEGGVAGKFGQALDAVLETVQDMRKVKLKVLGDDLAHGLEGELHDVLVRVRGGEVEHGEDVGPAGLDVGPLHVDHVGHAPHHHVPHRPALVVLHDVFKRTKKIFLKMKVCQLSLGNEFLGQLSERINSKEGNILSLYKSYKILLKLSSTPELLTLLHPTKLKCSPKTFQILLHCNLILPIL